MKTANLSEVKNRLSSYVDQVRAGGRVRILVRGVPVADLVPVEAGAKGDDDSWGFVELERRGVVRRGRGGIDSEILKPGPKLPGRPLSQDVVEERRTGR